MRLKLVISVDLQACYCYIVSIVVLNDCNYFCYMCFQSVSRPLYILKMNRELTSLEFAVVAMFRTFIKHKGENGKMSKDAFLKMLKEELPSFDQVRGSGALHNYKY